MKYRMLAFLIIILIVIADQYSKYYVQSLTIATKVEMTNNFNLVSVWNSGISFGIFDQMPYSNLLFIIITVIISAVLSFMVLRSQDKTIIIGAAVVLGGAIGNIIDRVRFSAVYDFIDLHIQNLHWPAFNIADAMVFIGIIIILIGDVSAKRYNKNV